MSGNLELQLEEFVLDKNSNLCGLTLESSGIGRDMGILIVAISRLDGSMEFAPKSTSMIYAGDVLVSLGESTNLIELGNLATAS